MSMNTTKQNSRILAIETSCDETSAAVVEDGDAAQVAADWQALQAGDVAEVEYNIESGPFAGVNVRIGVKGVEWTPPEQTGEPQ